MITNISNEQSFPATILRNLNNLYTTPAGTVVCDRDFGLDMSLLDLPQSLAKAKMVGEITQKTKKYEPRVKVESVTFTNSLDGELKSKVVINWI